MTAPPRPRRPLRALAAVLPMLAGLALLLPQGAVAAPPSDFFGVTAVGPAANDFGRMGKTGFGSYRIAVSWRTVQQERGGPYRWAHVDAAVEAAAAAGMRPALMLFGTPTFIHKAPGALYPPVKQADLREWKAFVRAAASRYGPGGEVARRVDGGTVRTWIIWNEQNARHYWYPRPNVRQYAKLLKASEQAITGVQPKSRIVLGGMYGYPRHRLSIDADKFLNRLYRVRGIKRRFDAVNVHPYGGGVGAVKRQIKNVRKAMRKGGDRRGRLVVGELGWASKGPKWSVNVVGRKGQAKRLRKGIDLLARKRRSWRIDAVYVYLWRDFPAGGACPWCPGAGLLNEAGKPKPALRAVRGAIRRAR